MAKSTTKPVTALNCLGDSELEALIMSSIRIPMDPRYIIRCYCRRCKRSYDATKNGINLLERKNPDAPIILPEGINDLRKEEQANQCFLVLEPCFMCREKEEKIISTAYLIPEKSLLDQYDKNHLNGRGNKNRNGHANLLVSHVVEHDKSSPNS